MNNNIVLIDCDGVLLDYNKAFAECYAKAYSVDLKVVFPRAYTAVKEYGIDMTKHNSYDDIYRDIEHLQMWRNMPALSGSVEAINRLVNKGYDVRCLTSMPPKYELDRLHNLQKLGFKIDKVYAVDRKIAKSQGIDNPKLEIIKSTNAIAFIDDLMKNFTECEGVQTELYWLDNQHPLEDNPNTGYDTSHVKRVISLHEFVEIFPQI